MSGEIEQIVLRNRGSEAIIDSRGARVTSLKVQGRELLAPGIGIEFSFPHTGPFPEPLSHLNGLAKERLWTPVGAYPKQIDTSVAALILDSGFDRLTRSNQLENCQFKLLSAIYLDPEGINYFVRIFNTGSVAIPTQCGFRVGVPVEDKHLLVTNLPIIDNRQGNPSWLDWGEDIGLSFPNRSSFWVEEGDRQITFHSNPKDLRNVFLRSESNNPYIILEPVDYFPAMDFYKRTALAVREVPVGDNLDYNLKITANV